MFQMKRIFSIILFSLLLISPQIVSAEWYRNFYIHGAFTNDRELKQDSSEPTFSKKDNFEKSATGGCRLRHWFSKFPYLGLAIDGSVFRADSNIDEDNKKDSDLLIVPISALAMGRIPILKDSDNPDGKFQLYGGAGPAMLYSKADIKDFFVVFMPKDLITEDSKDNSIDFGFASQFGLSWMVDRNLAIQLNFHYTHVDPKYSNRILEDNHEHEVEVETYQSLIGISYRF
jgi:opacity protein-like surface antigen